MHIPLLTVEQKISTTLPEIFALICHGWTSGTTHYVAVDASYPSNSSYGYSTALLSFGPVEHEESLTAKSLQECLTFTISIFNRYCDSKTALIGDNCAINKAVARGIQLGFVGCDNQRFKLAVKHIMENYEEIINSVNILMKKLKKYDYSCKTPPLHTVVCKTHQDTCWSSTYQCYVDSLKSGI